MNQTINVLHTVNPKDFMVIVENIESNIKYMHILPNDFIENHIQILKSKIRSTTPTKWNLRKKVGY